MNAYMNAKTFSTLHFFYNKDTKTFSSEASTLQDGFLGRLYSDACDEGFYMLSEKTGNIATFFLSYENKDKEGFVTSWVFYAPRESLIKNPGLEGVKVVVFND